MKLFTTFAFFHENKDPCRGFKTISTIQNGTEILSKPKYRDENLSNVSMQMKRLAFIDVPRC